MSRNLFARRYRPAWVALALVLALAVALSFAPVRALASNLLALFRVQKIEFVEVDPERWPDEDTLEAASRQFESVMQDQVNITVDGEPQVVDEETVRSLSIFPVRLPSALEDESHITLRPGVHATIQVDLARVRALLAELGYGDAELPDSLDGADISVDFHSTVVAAYGACEPGNEEWAEARGPTDFEGDCTVLTQMPSPSVSAPPELDIDQLGRAYLQLLGMSAEEATHFSQRVNWTTTLVVPIPRSPSMNLSYQDVNVDGVAGTFVRPPRRGQDQQEYLLTWVKSDIVYALLGSGTVEDALHIAGSLQ